MMMNKIFASDNRQRKEILEQELLEELGVSNDEHECFTCFSSFELLKVEAENERNCEADCRGGCGT